MIKFFRKIRQRLLTENKISKYLLYAIGEILLVVIGILIALSINNWNDNKNLAKKEHMLLNEMKSNLESDLTGLKWDINKNEGLLLANQVVLKSLDDRVYHDSLNYYYGRIKGNTVFVNNTTAFENLQSIGLNVIKNDSLRIKISNLYSMQYDYVRYMEQTRDEKFQYEQIIPLITKYLTSDLNYQARPINPYELSDNNEFKEILMLNCDLRSYMIETYKEIEKMISDLIYEIVLELNKYK